MQSKAVFRSVALSIVLTLATSPSAALLCRESCDAAADLQTVAADGCRHGQSSATERLAATEACPHLQGVTAIVREDVRRSPSGSDGRAAVFVPRHGLVAPAVDPSFLLTAVAGWSSGRRPLTLRI